MHWQRHKSAHHARLAARDLTLVLIVSIVISTDIAVGERGTLSDDEALFAQTFRAIQPKSFPKQGAIWFPPDSNYRRIPVCWESLADSTEDDRTTVRMAVKESWESQSRVEFSGWAQCVPGNKGIRITVEDVDATHGPHTEGLGNEIDGRPNGMSLDFAFNNWSPGCSDSALRRMCIRAIAIHEFGHALGFAHEQNRDDTPNWCKLIRDPQGESGDRQDVTPWDPTSVMNYCFNMYTSDLKLSKLDIYTAQKYYGKP
jgi:hypothetical protein